MYCECLSNSGRGKDREMELIYMNFIIQKMYTSSLKPFPNIGGENLFFFNLGILWKRCLGLLLRLLPRVDMEREPQGMGRDQALFSGMKQQEQ